jgi:hypothetical protein
MACAAVGPNSNAEAINVNLPELGYGFPDHAYSLSMMCNLYAILRDAVGGETLCDRLTPFFVFDAALRDYNSVVYDFNEMYKVYWKEEGKSKDAVRFFECVAYPDTFMWDTFMRCFANVQCKELDKNFLYQRFYEDVDLEETCRGFSDVAGQLSAYSGVGEKGRSVDSTAFFCPDKEVLDVCKTAIEVIQRKAAAACELVPTWNDLNKLKQSVIKVETGGSPIYKLAPELESVTDRISSVTDKFNEFEDTLRTVLQLLTHVYQSL